MNMGSHKTHQSIPSRASRGQTTSTHQTMIPPHDRTSQDHHQIGLYPSLLGLHSICSTKGSRTSNLTHICPTKSSRTSSSTHEGLPERLSNQGFQASDSTQVVTGLPGTSNSNQVKRNMRTNQVNKEINP